MARRSKFVRLENALGRRKGVRNPRALAAWIGDRKYGTHAMAVKSAASRRRRKRKRR
jgi:hypothetical protein